MAVGKVRIVDELGDEVALPDGDQDGENCKIILSDRFLIGRVVVPVDEKVSDDRCC